MFPVEINFVNYVCFLCSSYLNCAADTKKKHPQNDRGRNTFSLLTNSHRDRERVIVAGTKRNAAEAKRWAKAKKGKAYFRCSEACGPFCFNFVCLRVKCKRASLRAQACVFLKQGEKTLEANFFTCSQTGCNIDCEKGGWVQKDMLSPRCVFDWVALLGRPRSGSASRSKYFHPRRGVSPRRFSVT
jgi:hypothetical protein